MAVIKSDRTFFASRIVEGIFLAAYLLRKAKRQFRQVAFGNPFFFASKLDVGKAWRQHGHFEVRIMALAEAESGDVINVNRELDWRPGWRYIECYEIHFKDSIN